MDVLIDEYKTMLAEIDAADGSEDAGERIILALAERHDWSHSASATLMGLAQDYGSFMLRNALALAEALEIEDGSRGF